MLNEAKIEKIKQTLQAARNQQRLNPSDTMETRTYLEHIEHLLLELDHATTMNIIQANNIRDYVRRQEREASAKVPHASVR